MSAYGLAGLVDGFFQGKEYRHTVNKRADDKKRQAQLDKYREEAEARARERFGWDRQDRTKSQNDAAAIRGASEEAYAAAEAAMNAERGGQAPGSVAVTPPQVGGVPAMPGQPGIVATPSHETSPPTMSMPSHVPPHLQTGAAPDKAFGGGASYGGGAGASWDAAPTHSYEEWRSMDAEQRAAAGLPVSEVAGQWDYKNRDGAWSPSGTPDGQGVRYSKSVPPPVRDVDPNASGVTQDIQTALRSTDIARTLNQIGDGLATGKYGKAASPAARWASGVSDYFTKTPEEAAQSGEDLNRTAAVLEWYRSDAAKSHFQINPGDLNKAKSDPVGFFEALGGQDAPSVTQAPPGVQKSVPGSAAGPLGAVPEPVKNAPPNAAPMTSVAMETLGASPAPSTQAAVAAVGAVATTGGTFTEGQRSKAAASLMDHYREVGAPIVIKALLKRGDIEGAQKFQDWIEEAETKKGMESWSRAVFAASVGDFDTFSDEIVNAYNRLEYFGDGTTIVKDKSGFSKGDDGSITGAVITFKDEKSGDTFERRFDDPDDLVRMGVELLAPEEAFAWHMKNFEAAQTVKAAAAAKSLGAGDQRAQQLTNVLESLAKEDITFGTLPEEEKMARAMQRLAAIQQAASVGSTPQASGPPVAYRN